MHETQCKDFLFLFCEPVGVPVVLFFFERGDLFHHLRTEDRLAAAGGADRGHNGRKVLFENVAAGAESQGVCDIDVVKKGRKKQDTGKTVLFF